MDHTAILEVLVTLAGQAADLSNNLYAVGETTHQTGTDIENMANEIAILSAVLWRLHEEMARDLDRFTEAFMQDLGEIAQELTAIFEEVAEVARQLQKVDSQQQGAIKSFFRKSKVAYLQRHLEALKTTLVVMRTILQHGKEYGTQRSGTTKDPGRLSGSEPHVMFEDRTILDTVIKTNRDAILNLDEQDEKPSSPLSIDGHRRQSSSEPVIPPIPDTVSSTPRNSKAIDRKFSQRGVRLAVHMSILDMGAHSAPETLKDKWIQTSRSHRASHSLSGARPAIRPNSLDNPSSPLTDATADKANTSLRPRTSRGSLGKTPEKGGAYGWISKPTTEKLHKVIDHFDPGNSGGLVSKMLPSSHHRKRSSLNHSEVMDEGDLTALPQIPDWSTPDKTMKTIEGLKRS